MGDQVSACILYISLRKLAKDWSVKVFAVQWL